MSGIPAPRTQMAPVPAPVASRLARPRLLDPRLVVGILIVLLSVVLGARVVAGADRRVEVWVTTHDLGPSSLLTADDLAVRSVSLDQASSRYAAADQDLVGMVVTRPVGAGELLPVAAVSNEREVDVRRVVVEVDRPIAAGVTRGTVVDVYAVEDAASGEKPPAPELVLPAVTVAQDVPPASGFGSTGSRAGVALLVPQTDVARVIEAGSRGSLYLVQVPSGTSP